MATDGNITDVDFDTVPQHEINMPITPNAVITEIERLKRLKKQEEEKKQEKEDEDKEEKKQR